MKNRYVEYFQFQACLIVVGEKNKNKNEKKKKSKIL